MWNGGTAPGRTAPIHFRVVVVAMVKSSLVNHESVVPVPSDVKKGQTFSRLLRNIERAECVRQRRTAPAAPGGNDHTVFELIASRSRKAVATVVQPPVLLEHDAMIAVASTTTPTSSGTPATASSTAAHHRHAGPFLDVWDPTEHAYGHCFGCHSEVFIPDAEVVTRMGGISLMWHRECREKALAGDIAWSNEE